MIAAKLGLCRDPERGLDWGDRLPAIIAAVEALAVRSY